MHRTNFKEQLSLRLFFLLSTLIFFLSSYGWYEFFPDVHPLYRVLKCYILITLLPLWFLNCIIFTNTCMADKLYEFSPKRGSRKIWQNNPSINSQVTCFNANTKRSNTSLKLDCVPTIVRCHRLRTLVWLKVSCGSLIYFIFLSLE